MAEPPRPPFQLNWADKQHVKVIGSRLCLLDVRMSQTERKAKIESLRLASDAHLLCSNQLLKITWCSKEAGLRVQGRTHKHTRVKYVWTGRYVNSRPAAAVTSTLARHSVKCSNASGSGENKVAAAPSQWR